MKFLLLYISGRRTLRGGCAPLVEEYIRRSSRMQPVELRGLKNEDHLLALADSAADRQRSILWIADSAGDAVTSPQLSTRLTAVMDQGAQQVLFAIGPAEGWSHAVRARADWIVSFGRITLPHELALVVAAEQVYRALTLRAGHPYHKEG